MIQKTIREYYVLSAISSAAMGAVSATFVTFLLGKGLNLFEANLVNVFYYVTVFICEIPTGAFADTFGRKFSFIVSCLFMVLSGFVYAFSDGFWGFCVAEIIAAFGGTFASGAFTAWYVDKLRHHGFKDRLDKIFSRCTFIRQASNMTAGVIGACVANVSGALPWILSAVLFAVAGCVALFHQEEYFVRKKFSWHDGIKEMKAVAKSSFKYGFRNANIRFILIIVIIQSLVMQGPNMQWQPFFQEYLPNPTWFGAIKICITVGLMIGALLTSRILSLVKKDERMAMNVCQIVIGGSLIICAAWGWLPGALLMFIIHEIGRGGFQPITDAYLHDNVESKDRATIDSFQSLANHGSGVIGLVITGFLGLHLGVSWTWGICGGVLTLSALLLIRKNK